MGENARYRGEVVKIGTCEDMFYLRADQARLVQRERGSVDPIGDAAHLRFRFPWPDEDHVAPGAFERFERADGVHGAELPAGVEHRRVQFVAQAGYNVSLPCPESVKDLEVAPGITARRNGHRGQVILQQQRLVGQHLVAIVACGGCGAAFRLPTLEDARSLIDACRRRAKEGEWRPIGGEDHSRGEWWSKVAGRIEEGYTRTVNLRTWSVESASEHPTGQFRLDLQ